MNLQAVQQPALGLVALTGGVHPAAQNRLQVTELKNENKKYIYIQSKSIIYFEALQNIRNQPEHFVRCTAELNLN